MLGLLKLAGFPVASWAPSSVPRVLVEVFSTSLADLSQTVSNIARGGFVSLAEGEWLTLVASEFFGVERNPALFAEGRATLTDAGSAGPFTILPNQLWAASKSGLRFTNVNGGTLPLGGKLPLLWKAEAAGADYNVPAGDVSTLLTPLPGVTVTNPALPALGTWLLRQGVDAESDDALRERCHEKWSSLGAGGNAPAYAFHAKSASSFVTRVKVYEATPIGGEVTLVLAGPAGAITDPTVLPTVAAYLEDGRRPQCVTVHVVSATNRPIVLLGEVRVRATLRDPAIAFVSGQIADLQKSLDIGERVAIAELIQRVMDAPGVTNALLADASGTALIPGADDVVLGPNEVATFSDGLSWVSV
ncbi:MAG: baseplate J/gp47 family protein [Polyangiales bacterium]